MSNVRRRSGWFPAPAAAGGGAHDRWYSALFLRIGSKAGRDRYEVAAACGPAAALVKQTRAVSVRDDGDVEIVFSFAHADPFDLVINEVRCEPWTAPP